MKKLVILSMAFLFCLSATQGQTKKSERVALKKLEGTTVSTVANNNFITDFGNIPNVAWRRLGTYDEAAFTKNGVQMTAFYDYNGKLVGTTQAKKFTDLPAKGQEQIKKDFKDYTVGPVIFFDDNEFNETDMILYGVQFDDEDSYMVELTKGSKKIVVQVSIQGNVSFFKELSK
jgi:hypothetical protein